MKFARHIFSLLLAVFVVAQVSAQQTALQIDHVAIYVANLEKSVGFYHDVFGFQRVPMPVTFAAWLSMGHGVMLHVVSGRKEPVSNSKWDHISFACDDMDKFTASLEAKQIHWESMDGKGVPAVCFDGIKQIFLRDPDGYWIEINDAGRKK